MKKVLVLEDTPELLDSFVEVVESLDCEVYAAMTLQRAYSLLELHTFDLLLLDRELPDGDSIELAEFVNEFQYQTKVLFLSNYHKENDKVTGLRIGADDYLAKPISRTELLLRVKILLHRTKLIEDKCLRLKNIILNPETGELRIGKLIQQLRKKESLILGCLLRYKHATVSRETLISHVWGTESFIPTQTTLDVYIRRLRIVLNEYSNYLHTVRGFGYMLSDKTNGKLQRTIVPKPGLL